MSTSDSEFASLFHSLSAIANKESENLTEEILSRRASRSRKGDPITMSAYGYRRVKGKWEVDRSEAERVKKAFYLASQCNPYSVIRNMLDHMEERDKTGVAWTQQRLHYLLLNERYKGDVLTNKNCSIVTVGGKKEIRNRGTREQFYINDHHEALVGGETFDLVREAVLEGFLKTNRPSGLDTDCDLVCRMMKAGSEDPLLKSAWRKP